ncbi:hypothetical protein L9F63_005106 [Diploptera punctata]|uniref:Uncharacterized protein n=1 Tax=Diploptera punctata TaxID=6984 RepID=A0AAD7ZDR3_DIPPU|nr:hypothetical protein L9F63_005106 [Diploptera punctata]
MPQLKQPESLESTILKYIQNLVLDLGHQLTDKICSGNPATTVPTRWGVPSYLKKPAKNAFICPTIWELQPFFHPDLPLHLSDSVTTTVLKAISILISRAKCTNDAFSKTGDDDCREIFESLITSALHSRISHLDLLCWPWFIVLKLWPGSWSPVWAEVVAMLESDRCSMRHLTSFSMRCHCTDKVLQVLASSAKLQHLDIMSSVEVTDECVSYLIKLNKLKVVNMVSTSLTANGYSRLLNKMPQLSKLMWFDLNGQALSSVTTSPLGLQSYEASRVVINQLNILVQKCPYIIQISLHWVQADLSVLTELNYLQDIKLANCSALNSNLRGLLEVRGYNIKSLELHEVTEVNLLMIGILCTNLRKMNLVCDFVLHGGYSIGIPLFQHLEELMFAAQYSECLFFNCTNIKKLEISKCNNFSDNVVITLLGKNPLKQLEVLKVMNCGFLSLNSLHLLLESCDKLKVLEGLDSWGGITKLQVAELCLEIKKRNLNIEIFWKKPLQINW